MTIPQEIYVWYADDNGTWRIRKWDVHPFAEGTKYVNPALIASEKGLAEQELRNIANAKRFDKERFSDDSAFADWAQSRCRGTLERIK